MDHFKRTQDFKKRVKNLDLTDALQEVMLDIDLRILIAALSIDSKDQLEILEAQKVIEEFNYLHGTKFSIGDDPSEYIAERVLKDNEYVTLPNGKTIHYSEMIECFDSSLFIFFYNIQDLLLKNSFLNAYRAVNSARYCGNVNVGAAVKALLNIDVLIYAQQIDGNYFVVYQDDELVKFKIIKLSGANGGYQELHSCVVSSKKIIPTMTMMLPLLNLMEGEVNINLAKGEHMFISFADILTVMGVDIPQDMLQKKNSLVQGVLDFYPKYIAPLLAIDHYEAAISSWYNTGSLIHLEAITWDATVEYVVSNASQLSKKKKTVAIVTVTALVVTGAITAACFFPVATTAAMAYTGTILKTASKFVVKHAKNVFNFIKGLVVKKDAIKIASAAITGASVVSLSATAIGHFFPSNKDDVISSVNVDVEVDNYTVSDYANLSLQLRMAGLNVDIGVIKRIMEEEND